MAREPGDRADSLRTSSSRPPSSPFDGSTRARLMTAMVDVVSHGGYRGASVDRVLESAHLGWADFTHEFTDLEDCFLATMDAGFACVALVAAERVSGVGPDATRTQVFEACLAAVLSSLASHRALTRLCLVDAAALGARAVERKDAGLQRLVRLIDDGLSTTDGHPVSPIAVEMVVGGIFEVLQRKARAGEIADASELTSGLRRLWLPLVR